MCRDNVKLAVPIKRQRLTPEARFLHRRTLTIDNPPDSVQAQAWKWRRFEQASSVGLIRLHELQIGKTPGDEHRGRIGRGERSNHCGRRIVSCTQ